MTRRESCLREAPSCLCIAHEVMVRHARSTAPAYIPAATSKVESALACRVPVSPAQPSCRNFFSSARNSATLPSRKCQLKCPPPSAASILSSSSSTNITVRGTRAGLGATVQTEKVMRAKRISVACGRVLLLLTLRASWSVS